MPSLLMEFVIIGQPLEKARSIPIIKKIKHISPNNELSPTTKRINNEMILARMLKITPPKL
jgi:hypothetical protein